jgi:hypothetical protein
MTDKMLALARENQRLTVFASANFVLVLLGAGIAYELWTNGARWRGRASAFLFGPIVIAGLALNRWHSKLTVLYVVLGCGLIGVALQLTVL